MRKLLGVVAVTTAALVAAPGHAADMIEYPPIEIPPVDYELGGSFYLRGSAAVGAMWGTTVQYRDCVAPCGGTVVTTNPVTGAGYGYSVGAGFGYETGDGLRGDFTVDYLVNNGMTDGTNTLNLRSTIALANAYYDFNLGGFGMGGGGLGAYVGAGIGAAYNQTSVTAAVGAGPDGANWAPAAALMTGITYDMGDMVADLGYRLIYMPQITNGDAALPAPSLSPYYVNNATIHELRGTLRYRLN